MKAIKFDRDQQKYDALKRFYIPLHGPDYSPNAVVFDTGEFAYLSSNAPPEQRKAICYNREPIGVRIVGTTDQEAMSRYKFKTPNGEEIKHAWLNWKGMYDLLLDECTGRAVGIQHIGLSNSELRRMYDQQRLMIPHTLRARARAYISGPGEAPVGSPITYYPPSIITKEKREHVISLVAASKAWCAFKEIEFPKGKDMPVSWSNPYLDDSFERMPESLRMQLVRSGLVNGREEVHVPYVTI